MILSKTHIASQKSSGEDETWVGVLLCLCLSKCESLKKFNMIH